jgi:SAM-dependent methyltransferase
MHRSRSFSSRSQTGSGLAPARNAEERLLRVARRRPGSEPGPRKQERRPACHDDTIATDAVDSQYDAIATLYDPWSRSVTEDVGFYVELALETGGPVVELGVGTGRIAVPTALMGIRVIGVDSSRGMLDVCRARAERAGVSALVDLRLGDLRRPPVDERVPLVTCPFRAFLHLGDDDERLGALEAARELLLPGGRFVFDVFEPGADDIEDTHGRWIEREPGIFERADWDTERRTLTLSVRGQASASTMKLSWITPAEWRRLIDRAGLEVEAQYGWFDRRPYEGGEDTIWVTRRL